MNVEIISDLCEIEGFSPETVLDELFAYLNTDQRLELVYDIARTYDIDIEELTITDIMEPIKVIEEADQHFSTYFQREFIKHFLKLYN